MGNVSEHPDGFLVRVSRDGVIHQRFVAGRSDRARQRADMLAAALRAKHPRRAQRSVTFSEGVDRIQVGWYDDASGKRKGRSFRFRPETRDAVRERALAFRRECERELGLT